jgi:hypothetical protein
MQQSTAARISVVLRVHLATDWWNYSVAKVVVFADAASCALSLLPANAINRLASVPFRVCITCSATNVKFHSCHPFFLIRSLCVWQQVLFMRSKARNKMAAVVAAPGFQHVLFIVPEAV